MTLAKRWKGPPQNTIVTSIQQEFEQLNVKFHVKEIVLFRIFPKQIPKYKMISHYELQEG